MFQSILAFISLDCISVHIAYINSTFEETLQDKSHEFPYCQERDLGRIILKQHPAFKKLKGTLAGMTK